MVMEGVFPVMAVPYSAAPFAVIGNDDPFVARQYAADGDVMGVRHEYAVPAFKGGKGLQVGGCEHRLVLSIEAACGDVPRSRSAVIIIPAEREM